MLLRVDFLDRLYKFDYSFYTFQIFHNKAKIVPKVQYFIVQGYGERLLILLNCQAFFVCLSYIFVTLCSFSDNNMLQL